MLVTGMSANLNAEKIENFKEACIKGDAAKYLNLGLLHIEGKGAAKDDFKAAEFFKKSCDDGCGLGCSYLGSMYEKGLGIRQDDIKAIELFKKGCSSGVVLGCNNYIFTLINDKSVSKIKELLKKSCDDGSGYMCSNSGMAYEMVIDIKEQDSVEVMEYYTKGCDKGDARGCYLLGRMHKEGRGTQLSNSKAKELFGKACDGGDADGCKEYAKLNKKKQ